MKIQIENANIISFEVPPKVLAFDMDGTLTPFAHDKIPLSLMRAIAAIPLDVRLIICTGRPIDYVMERLKEIWSLSENPSREMARWSIITNNGVIAYELDESLASGTRILFEMHWPKSVSKEEIGEELRKRSFSYLQIELRDNNVVQYFAKHLYESPEFVRRQSAYWREKWDIMLSEMNWDDDFKVMNSGLGNLILPKNAGKAQAMVKLAELYDIKAEELICIGDSPEPQGNDEDFLCGEFGFGVNVGAKLETNPPYDLVNAEGERLMGPEAVEELLAKLSAAW